MIELKNYRENIKYLSKLKCKNNEYLLNVNGKEISSHYNTIVPEGLASKTKTFEIFPKTDSDKKYAQNVLTEKAINRFHPNKINNKDFWKLAKCHFKLFSVCGAPCNNISEVNNKNLEFTKSTGIFYFLENNLNKNSNVLEIGFGYGNIFNEISERCNYVGIDYNVPYFLKKYRNLVSIDKSGIPDNLYKKDYYDIIYSSNVLQHCSQQDRFEYFKQASHCLKKGGYMIFSSFIMTEENKNSFCWGSVDEDGRGYTSFLNQLTEVDRLSELDTLFDDLGFDYVDKSVIFTNHFNCIIKKR